jgi:hypothetical protein
MSLHAGVALGRYDVQDTTGRLFQPGVRREDPLFQLFRWGERGVAGTESAFIGARRAQGSRPIFHAARHGKTAGRREHRSDSAC